MSDVLFPRKPSLGELASPRWEREISVNPGRELAEQAARLSAIEAAGGMLTPDQRELVEFAKRRGLTDPLSSFPSVVHGVPTGAQERIMKTFEAISPLISGQPVTPATALNQFPVFPPGFPDWEILPPPPRLSALELPLLTVEEILQLMRGPRRI